MQIEGNGSHSTLLRWFEDRAGPVPDAPWMLSAPMTVYRLVMLAWALWLALAVLGWLRWGSKAFGDGGFWKKGPPRPARPQPGAAGKAPVASPVTVASSDAAASPRAAASPDAVAAPAPARDEEP